MLGRFLELSVATPDIAASFDFYSRLGFTQADAGEVWPHTYVVVTDGRIHIGLHQGTGRPVEGGEDTDVGNDQQNFGNQNRKEPGHQIDARSDHRS